MIGQKWIFEHKISDEDDQNKTEEKSGTMMRENMNDWAAPLLKVS